MAGLFWMVAAGAAAPIDLRSNNQPSPPVGIERRSPYLYHYENDWQRNRPWRERKQLELYMPAPPAGAEKPRRDTERSVD